MHCWFNNFTYKKKKQTQIGIKYGQTKPLKHFLIIFLTQRFGLSKKNYYFFFRVKHSSLV